MDVLCKHSWPGNVRELENALERASVLCDGGIIKVADLPPAVRNSGGTIEGDETELFPSLIESDPAPAFSKVNGQTQIPTLAANGSMPPLKNFLREQEVLYLNRVLDYTDGDKEKAASMLGVSVATIYRKLSEEESAA